MRIRRRPLSPLNRRQAARRHYALLTALLILGAGLRFYRIGASSLRGDEAFTIRYWAAPFSDVLHLAQVEPHPIGIFFAFGAWKALAGDTELAMRWLPALVNLLGIPALYGLGRRLLGKPRSRNDTGQQRSASAAGYLAALLWAIHPFLIWHSQDARDYAIWSGLSALALLALLRAVTVRQAGWRLWFVYAVAALCAMYSFFLEPFLVVAGAAAVLLWRPRRALPFVLTWITLIPALLPWLWQIGALAGSGYRGTAGGIVLPALWEQFAPTLTFGETVPALLSLWPIVLVVIAGGLIVLARSGRWRVAAFLTALIALPIMFLVVLSTRMNVYLPRYVIAIVPALILCTAATATGITQAVRTRLRPRPARLTLIAGAALAIAVGSALPLAALWHSGYHKASDWRALRDYLVAHIRPADTILFSALDPATGALDPAFGYYFRAVNPALALPGPGDPPATAIATLIATGRPVWFIPSGPQALAIDALLRAKMQLISDRGVGADWIVREFRSPAVQPGEIGVMINAAAGAGAQLIGYSLDHTADQLTVILFWGALGIPRHTVTVQLIGATEPGHPSPLWSQDDHPASGLRDVYTLPLGGLAPGSYTLQIGLYDPAAPNRRDPWLKNGLPTGDSLPIATLTRGPDGAISVRPLP